MGLGTFRGGVHPYEGKELSKDKPIQDLLAGGELAFLLSQHIGAPAKAIVAAGDTVLRGQMIAEAGGFVSSPIFSSVSGTVKGIEKRRTATGDFCDAIIITNDGENREVEYEKVEDYKSLSKEEIISKVQNAGVVGMGGAGFPTHVKLSPKEPDKIEYIIANGAECEPYLTSDYRLMMEQPEKLITGMNIILQLFPGAKGIIGIENNKPDCIELLSKLCEKEERIEVCALKTKFPQGGERQLIHATTGRDINSKMLPADAGCIVDNVGTISSIYEAVVEGKPVIEQIVTISGDGALDPRNYRIPVGISYQDLVDANGGMKDGVVKMISGGTMMGFAMFDLSVPTTKTTSSILLLTEDEASKYEATACINCGRCVEACPERLVPSRLSKFSEHGQKAEFEKWYGLECIECGSCSFVCPAKRSLAQGIRLMKRQVLADKRAQASK